MVELYKQIPDDLNVKFDSAKGNVHFYILESEVDEMWSFVGSKKNKQWIWIAIDSQSRQVIAFHVGDRSRKGAKALWKKIPQIYKQKAMFYTDDWEAYKGVIPSQQHRVVAKKSGKTNIIERFNCTMRQRISRLVRSALSFSKNLENHIGASKYFIFHYNQALLV